MKFKLLYHLIGEAFFMPMRNLILILIVAASHSSVAQMDISEWELDYNSSQYRLPLNCKYVPYHTKEDGWKFLDTAQAKFLKASYQSIIGAGDHHFIVKNKSGYYLVDADLNFRSKVPCDIIINELHYWNGDYEFDDAFSLKRGEEISILIYESDKKSYQLISQDSGEIEGPIPAPEMVRRYLDTPRRSRTEKFRPKHVNYLTSHPNSNEFQIVTKKRKYIVKFGNDYSLKSKKEPFIYGDFMVIDHEKSGKKLYHKSSLTPVMTNYKEPIARYTYQMTDSDEAKSLLFTIDSERTRRVFNQDGEEICTSLYDFEVYDYKHLSHQFQFLITGGSIFNFDGVKIYDGHSNLQVGEHYVFDADGRGAWLYDLTIPLEFIYKRIETKENITIGQTASGEIDVMSINKKLATGMSDYGTFGYQDNLLVYSDSKSIIIDKFDGTVEDEIDGKSDRYRGFSSHKLILLRTTRKLENGTIRMGAHQFKKGTFIEAKYRRIVYKSNGEHSGYFIVLRENGEIGYILENGKALFD